MKNIEIHFKNPRLEKQESERNNKSNQSRIAFNNKIRIDSTAKIIDIAKKYVAEQKEKGNNITLANAIDYIKITGLTK